MGRRKGKMRGRAHEGSRGGVYWEQVEKEEMSQYAGANNTRHGELLTNKEIKQEFLSHCARSQSPGKRRSQTQVLKLVRRITK